MKNKYTQERLKGRSIRILLQEFPELKEWCKHSLWALGCYHGSVGHAWEETIVEDLKK